MNTRWSLDDLYTGFDSEEYKNDMAALESAVARMRRWASDNLTGEADGSGGGGAPGALEKIEEYIRMTCGIMKFYTLPSYASLVLSVDTTNGPATKAVDMLDELFTELSEPSVMFDKYVGRLGEGELEGLIAKSPLLAEHAFMLRTVRGNYRYLLSDKEEVLLAKLQTTGSSAWGRMFDQLTSTLPVDAGGKNVPLAVARDMAYDKNPETRKSAYEAELKAYERVDKPLAFALNSIKGEVLTTSKLRGYASPLEMSLKNSHMDGETLEAMFSALRDALPSFRKYFRKKAGLLGHGGGLPFYDLFAPMGDVSMKFTYDEAADFVIANFYGFSKKLGDFAKRAFESGWIDAEPREGKRGGAFCHSVHAIKQSRVMCNFTGTLNNVLTLAHELGHAYHAHCLNGESPLNADYPMQLAETASNFCEIILTEAAMARASDKERLVIREQAICDAAQVTVDIYSRFLFESRVFESRANGGLSVGELKSLMLGAQRDAYGDGLDPGLLHPYMWACKPHYYDANYNFYNFPYAYGMLFARGLYAFYQKDKDAFAGKYDGILVETGRNDLRGVGKAAGIDVGGKQFWASSFTVVEREIDEWAGGAR